MTLRTLDREDEAKQLLEPITEKMDIIENQHYHQLLLMYKGHITAEDLLKKVRAQGSLAIATVGYGIGNWYMNNGEEDKAKEVYEGILRTGGWAGFGYIAAEADLKWLCIAEDQPPFFLRNKIIPNIAKDVVTELYNPAVEEP